MSISSISFRQYFHPPALAAGLASVLIGYSSSAVIIFQAAQAAGASAEQIEILAGQAVLQNLLIFPIILIVAFIGLHLVVNNNKRTEKCAS